MLISIITYNYLAQHKKKYSSRYPSCLRLEAREAHLHRILKSIELLWPTDIRSRELLIWEKYVKGSSLIQKEKRKNSLIESLIRQSIWNMDHQECEIRIKQLWTHHCQSHSQNLFDQMPQVSESINIRVYLFNLWSRHHFSYKSQFERIITCNPSNKKSFIQVHQSSSKN